MNPFEFKPVPGIWRFHLIYLVLALGMAWAFLPYSPVFQSLLIVAGFCVLGILLCVVRQTLAAHIVALTIGLGTPIVFIFRPVPLPTTIIFLVLLAIVVHYRDEFF